MVWAGLGSVLGCLCEAGGELVGDLVKATVEFPAVCDLSGDSIGVGGVLLSTDEEETEDISLSSCFVSIGSTSFLH